MSKPPLIAIVVFSIVSFIFMSCEKSDEEKKLRIKKTITNNIYLNSLNMEFSDTTEFFYNEAGLLSEVKESYGDGLRLFYNNSGQLSRVNVFEDYSHYTSYTIFYSYSNDSISINYDNMDGYKEVAILNSTGEVVKYEYQYLYDNWKTARRWEFTWLNGNLTRATEVFLGIQKKSGTIGKFYKKHFKRKFKLFCPVISSSMVEPDTSKGWEYTFMYDSKKNPFHSMDFFKLNVFPMNYSKNNIKAETGILIQNNHTNSYSVNYNYEYNGDGYPVRQTDTINNLSEECIFEYEEY